MTTAQPPDDDPQMELLRVSLEGGRPALDELADQRRRWNSHRAGSTSPFPPSRFRTTIAEVAVDGTIPAAGHEERVRTWAADTVQAWTGPQPASGSPRCSVVVRNPADDVTGRLQRLPQQPTHVPAAGAVDTAPPVAAGGHQPGDP